MKIAFLIQEIHPNAGQTYNISEIIKYLITVTDWQMTVFATKISYPIPEGFQNERVSIRKIDQLYSLIIFSRGMAKMLKEYDLIYVKGSYPFVFPAVRSGKPNILVVHQMDCWRLFSGTGKKIRIIATNMITGYVIKKPDAIVTVTEELGVFYRKKYGVGIRVIEDQISDAYFNASKRKEIDKSGNVKLLTVGNWDGYSGRKRHHILLSYFCEAVKQLPSIHLSMVGLSQSNILDLEKLCMDLGISNKITLKASLPEEELLKEYTENDVYVTATTYEGFYRQIVEGFASGMPALAFDSKIVTGEVSSAAAANHIIKSGGGKLYHDSESFLLSLNDIIDHYEELSENAFKYSGRYSKEIVGYKTEHLINELIHDKMNEYRYDKEKLANSSGKYE